MNNYKLLGAVAVFSMKVASPLITPRVVDAPDLQAFYQNLVIESHDGLTTSAKEPARSDTNSSGR